MTLHLVPDLDEAPDDIFAKPGYFGAELLTLALNLVAQQRVVGRHARVNPCRQRNFHTTQIGAQCADHFCSGHSHAHEPASVMPTLCPTICDDDRCGRTGRRGNAADAATEMDPLVRDIFRTARPLENEWR